jgi:deazaflavin-dependent oxidoreductase (nitroreductase family)
MAATSRMSFLRPFTTHVFNPVARLFAGWLPGFAILTYRGRKSGRTYRTPINVFRHGDEYVFALTYGSDVQWVKNVIAAGGCEIRVRGRDVRLVDPEVFVDPTRRLMPLPVRLILALDRVDEFLRMRRA